MESKNTLTLFVFLAFCFAEKDLYAQAIEIVAQNKGYPDRFVVEERFFCEVISLKGFVGFARENSTSSNWSVRF